MSQGPLMNPLPDPERERQENQDSRQNDSRSFHSFQGLLISYMLFILILSGVLSGSSYMLIFFFGIVPHFLLTHPLAPVMVILLLIVFALLLTLRLARGKFRPIDHVIRAMSRVSEGDFSVRVEEENTTGQIGALVHSYNEMAQELGSIELFRKDFINNFSHEFKTPIVSIRGFAKQLERDDLTDEQRREYASIIVRESERLANMSSNVLLLTKLENQKIVTDRTEFALDEQLRSCLLLLEKQWESKELELVLNLDEVRFVGNEEMMSHVWVNLISNAVKFSPPRGRLELSCLRRDSRVIVTIRDNGPGMDAATQARIFEKFYQGDSAHATEGNGLGMPLVKRIVDLCGGTIHIQSAPSQGTSFTVTLPN